MTKAGVVLAVLTSGVVGSVSAQDRWIEINPGYTPQISLDTTKIVARRGEVFRVWLKMEYAAPQSGTGINGQSFEYSQLMQQIDINCKTQQLNLVRNIFYDADQRTVNAYTAPYESFFDPSPESIGEIKVVSICDYVRKSGLWKS
ncbi:MAG TPA: surface-adhesin E family protein [Gemmatimonadales bacterium]|nr:surface-adhesin E family protein [Gemmatimonadales bacterium]